MLIRPIDFAIILLYLAGITAFGARFRKRQQTLRDYFLWGRTAPWWALGCSIVATETSTLTIIGTPAIAFGGNLGFLQLVLGYLLARVILCLVLVPQYFQGEFYTAYQLLEKRFGARMKSVAAVGFLGTRALAEGVRIAAIGKVVSVAFGTGMRSSIAIIAALTMFYTFEGGMSAVIWTDVIQLFLYIAGSLAAFFLLLHKIPGGWPAVIQTASAAGGKFRVFDFTFSLTRSYTFWSGLLGGTFLTMASHGTDQTMVQRLLAARNERDAKKALLGSGVVIFAQFALFLVLGVMLFVFAMHAPLLVAGGDTDRILPEFVVRYMPAGLAGLGVGIDFRRSHVQRQRRAEFAGFVKRDRSRIRQRHGRREGDRAWYGYGRKRRPNRKEPRKQPGKSKREARPVPPDHPGLGRRAGPARDGELGACAPGRTDHRIDYLWRVARSFPAGYLEPARK